MQKYLPTFVLRTEISCFRSKKIRTLRMLFAPCDALTVFLRGCFSALCRCLCLCAKRICGL